jgi:hypothetical protein
MTPLYIKLEMEKKIRKRRKSATNKSVNSKKGYRRRSA